MIYKIIYYCFDIQITFQRWITNNIYLMKLYNIYRDIYIKLKKIIYQIPPQPKSVEWVNTIAICQPFYYPSSNKYYFSYNDIFYFFQKKFYKKTFVYENFYEFQEETNITKIDEKTMNKKTDIAVQLIEDMKSQCSNSSDTTLKYHLFIYKNAKCYFTKILYQNKNYLSIIPKNENISNVNFLMIEYIHPSLKDPLLIDLTSYNFAIESHILNFVFVYWYLKNIYGNWTERIYDMNYKLNIIDQNCKYIELTSFEFIHLKKDDYTIEKIFSLI